MNARQRRFCEELVKGASATQAYILAGYSSKGSSQSAERLLRNADIKKRIAELQGDMEAESRITFGWIVRRTRQALEDAAKDNSHHSVIRGLDMLAKLHGHYERDNEQKNPLSNLSDEELIGKVDLLCRKLGYKVEPIK